MIRPIQPEDAQALADICGSRLGHEASAEHIAARISELRDNDQYYLAVYEDEDTQQVLGFIQAERYDLLYGCNGWNVIALAASSEAKGREVGRKLLEALEQTARGSGSTFIRLNCNVIRTDAHAFYEHMGYRCDKTQKRFIKKWMPDD